MDDPLSREIQLAFWKVHILHHAAEGRVYGQSLMEELRRHGFEVSPGTLYPLLARMESQGWIQRSRVASSTGSPKARREFRIAPKGTRVLARLRQQVDELHREVVRDVNR